MLDFHIHVDTTNLLPAEAIRHARFLGYRGIGLIVRSDGTTLSLHLPWILQHARKYALYNSVEVFVGVELVHIPTGLLADVVAEARALGAHLVLAHGESLDGMAEPGTNHAAIQARVDILAHPGLITLEDIGLAAEHRVVLEITSAPLHCLANAHVLNMAKEHDCGAVFGSSAKKKHHMLQRDVYQNMLRCIDSTKGCAKHVITSQNRLLQRLMQLK